MWIILGVLAVPLIEIALFVTLGAALGLWLTLAWVILTAVVGILLLRLVAMTGAHRLTSGVRENMRDPLSPVAHQVLVGVAGILLLLPGFLTDTLGILLLIPAFRRILIRFLASRVKASAVVVRNDVVEGEWRDVTSDPTRGPASQPGNPPSEWTRH
jgi:UPF0716 protein FxsA